MSYECPLEIINMPLEITESEISKMARDIAEGVESHVMATVRTHVNVDKEKLREYLRYLGEMLDTLEEDGLIRRLVLFEEEI